TEDETDDGATGTTELAGTPGPSATTGGAEAALPEAPADEPLAGAFVSGKPVSSGPRAPESAAADSATSGTAGPTGAIAGGVSAPADDFFSKPKGQSGWFGQGKFFLARLVGRGGSAPVVSVPTETDSSPAK
ncbi:MAG TPA: hypothetical protein VD963_05695, partial [Phycisphaerales bacterium]|nr:hypothetical protein [Phycisphaerales bacterium]